jgi:hypothetical protein
LALAYYVMFAELYSEITSLHADLKIRQNIRTVAKDDTTLLRSIATGEKEKEVETVEMIATRKQQRNRILSLPELSIRLVWKMPDSI